MDTQYQHKPTDWMLNGFVEQTGNCHLCRWGKPTRACNLYIYVPEMSTKRIYVVDIVTEEIVQSIQLNVVPYQCHFFQTKNKTQIWIQTLGSPSLFVIENPCNVKAIKATGIEDISNIPVGHMSLLFHVGLRGSTHTAIVSSYSTPLVAELNLHSYHFSSIEINTNVYGCQTTAGWTFSFLNGHAFASCFRDVGQCPLMEINTLTMQILHSTPMKSCAFSHASPDGHYVVSLPQYNSSSSPDVMVHRLSSVSGARAIHVCTIPINATVGRHFPSDVVYVGKPNGWNIYVTFKELKVLAKVSLDDCHNITLVDSVGRMLKRKRTSLNSLAGWTYQRPIAMIGHHVGRYLATPAKSQNLIALIDTHDDSVRTVQNIDGPYHTIGGGGVN